MKFETKKRIREVKYFREDMELARKLADRTYKEMKGFVQALVLFGSTARGRRGDSRDVDILIIIDDVHIELTRDVVETYRIVLAKIIGDLDKDRLHVQSMKLSSFWEYVRAGDPIAINILRDGIALIDTGFFDPLQALLDEGRIRPSKEAMQTYFIMSKASSSRAKQHLLTAAVDCYWAAIDSAHSALMGLGVVPVSPEDVPDILEEKLVRSGIIERRYINIMRELYMLSKKISNREIREIKGKDYDRYRKMSEEFVERMKKYIEKRK